MRALVIYESMFGNTREVARAIGDGLAERARVDVVEVGDALPSIPEDVSLLVVGGPTHAFGMTRASTRAEAAKQADDALVSQGIGVREWLAGLEQPDRPVLCASFDTHMDRPHVIAQLGSAAGPIQRRLRKLGLDTAATSQHFWVTDTKGPLREGQLARARAWGQSLSLRVATGVPA